MARDRTRNSVSVEPCLVINHKKYRDPKQAGIALAKVIAGQVMHHLEAIGTLERLIGKHANYKLMRDPIHGPIERARAVERNNKWYAMEKRLNKRAFRRLKPHLTKILTGSYS